MKIKTAAGKVPFDLIPLSTLMGIARVFGYGAKKYERDNWKLAADAGAVSRYKGAILRHLAGMEQDPQAVDEESGLPHVYHLGCSVVMLIGLLQLHHGMAVDPGEGREPPSALEPTVGYAHTQEPTAAYKLKLRYCTACGFDFCKCAEYTGKDYVEEEVTIYNKPGSCRRCGYLCCSCYGGKFPEGKW